MKKLRTECIMKNLLLPEEKRNYAERELWKSLEESNYRKNI